MQFKTLLAQVEKAELEEALSTSAERIRDVDDLLEGDRLRTTIGRSKDASDLDGSDLPNRQAKIFTARDSSRILFPFTSKDVKLAALAAAEAVFNTKQTQTFLEENDVLVC